MVGWAFDPAQGPQRRLTCEHEHAEDVKVQVEVLAHGPARQHLEERLIGRDV